jgi:dephospho-CoA kinase
MGRSDRFAMIDADKVAHDALKKSGTIHEMMRERLYEIAGTLDAKELSRMSFENPTILEGLRLASEPVLRLDILEAISNIKTPIILLNSVFLIENGWVPTCKRNVILVQAKPNQIGRWLRERGDDEVARLLSQMGVWDRRAALEREMAIGRKGCLWIFNNSSAPAAHEEADALSEQLLAFYG